MDHASGLVFHRPPAASSRRAVVYFCSAVLTITAITSIATFGVAFAFAKIASMCAVSRAVAQGVPAAEAAQFSGVTRAGLLAARARNVAASQRAIAAAGGWQNASLFARVGSEWAKFNLIMGKTYPLTGFVGTGMFADLGLVGSLALGAPGAVGAFVINKQVASTASEMLGEPNSRSYITVGMEQIPATARTRLRARLLHRLDAIQTQASQFLKRLPKSHLSLIALPGPAFFKLSGEIQDHTVREIALQVTEFQKATERGRLSANWRSRLDASETQQLWVCVSVALRQYWRQMQSPIAAPQQQAMIVLGQLTKRLNALFEELGRNQQDLISQQSNANWQQKQAAAKAEQAAYEKKIGYKPR